MSEHSPQPYRTPTEVDDQAENKLVISRVAIWAGVAMMAAGLIVYQRFQSKQVTLPKVLPTPYYLFDDLADVGSQRTYTVQVPTMRPARRLQVIETTSSMKSRLEFALLSSLRLCLMRVC